MLRVIPCECETACECRMRPGGREVDEEDREFGSALAEVARVNQDAHEGPGRAIAEAVLARRGVADGGVAEGPLPRLRRRIVHHRVFPAAPPEADLVGAGLRRTQRILPADEAGD